MPTPQLHERMPVRRAGAALEQAHAAMIMLHGRGASAEDILGLAYALNAPGVAFFAPQAAQSAWYPNRFIAPVASNEPWLSSALAVVNGLVETVLAAGLKAEQTLILGFSQGGCLALEYAARHARRYGGVIGLSAGLIENGDQPRTYAGTLSGTPVLLGCSDVDQHISLARVERTAQVLAELGAVVDKRIYPGMGHTVNQDEVDGVQAMLDSLQ